LSEIANTVRTQYKEIFFLAVNNRIVWIDFPGTTLFDHKTWFRVLYNFNRWRLWTADYTHLGPSYPSGCGVIFVFGWCFHNHHWCISCRASF